MKHQSAGYRILNVRKESFSFVSKFVDWINHPTRPAQDAIIRNLIKTQADSMWDTCRKLK